MFEIQRRSQIVVGGVILLLLGTLSLGAQLQAAEAECGLEEVNGVVNLTWPDDGGRHVIRRNGRWLATPGAGTSTFADTAPLEDATYLVRTRFSGGGGSIDRECALIPGDVEPPEARRFVVHVSMDGLRSDHVTTELMPNMAGLADRGAATMNARTDPAITKTLANHTSQFTGRFVWGPTGHRIIVNEDPGDTVHDSAGEYVSSVFDVVHDHGGRTVVYVGKSKFYLHERSWNGEFGAPDVVGEDNGRNKIDVFEKEDPVLAAKPFVDDLIAGQGDTYGFFHIRTPDSAGHTSQWNSDGYRQGVMESDAILGDLLGLLEVAGVLADTTIIVTSDHGGPTGDDGHEKADLAENYTVPFVVSGVGVGEGLDLYELNVDHRTDPGTGRPNKSGPQPIRGHDVANLVLDLLGLPAIPGSLVNADQSLLVN